METLTGNARVLIERHATEASEMRARHAREIAAFSAGLESHGIKAQTVLAAARQAMSVPLPLSLLPPSKAIQSVLRQRGEPMNIGQIVAALAEGGVVMPRPIVHQLMSNGKHLNRLWRRKRWGVYESVGESPEPRVAKPRGRPPGSRNKPKADSASKASPTTHRASPMKGRPWSDVFGFRYAFPVREMILDALGHAPQGTPMNLSSIVEYIRREFREDVPTTTVSGLLYGTMARKGAVVLRGSGRFALPIHSAPDGRNGAIGA